jgi:hypothetical protein
VVVVHCSTVYAFAFFCITTALLCNKRVKYKYLEIAELIFAVVLFISTLVAASLVRALAALQS